MALKRDKHDIVFSQLVRERANYECDYCGRQFRHEPSKLHCSHFKSRRHKSTRYHPFNAFDRVARLAGTSVKLKPWQMDELYQHMKIELKRIQALRASGLIGRIEFTLPDWYQQGITYQMGDL